jgi:hypothetical protein
MGQFDKQTSSRLGVTTIVTTSAASAATSAFGPQTYQVRVVSTAAVNFRIGDGSPVAVATDAYLPANVVDYFSVSPGQKLAAIGNATVSVTEMS